MRILPLCPKWQYPLKSFRQSLVGPCQPLIPRQSQSTTECWNHGGFFPQPLPFWVVGQTVCPPKATQVVSSKRTNSDQKPQVKSSPTLSDQLLSFLPLLHSFSVIYFQSYFLTVSPFVFLLNKPEILNPGLVQGSLSDIFPFSFVQLQEKDSTHETTLSLTPSPLTFDSLLSSTPPALLSSNMGCGDQGSTAGIGKEQPLEQIWQVPQFVLVLFHCITNYSKIQWLRQ